jgi:hypothetical protein
MDTWEKYASNEYLYIVCNPWDRGCQHTGLQDLIKGLNLFKTVLILIPHMKIVCFQRVPLMTVYFV